MKNYDKIQQWDPAGIAKVNHQFFQNSLVSALARRPPGSEQLLESVVLRDHGWGQCADRPSYVPLLGYSQPRLE